MTLHMHISIKVTAGEKINLSGKSRCYCRCNLLIKISELGTYIAFHSVHHALRQVTRLLLSQDRLRKKINFMKKHLVRSSRAFSRESF